jgi:hypothetical protein
VISGFLAVALAQSVPAAFKVIAFYSDKAATGNGYLGIDPAHISFAHESNGFFPGFGAANGFTYDSTMDWTKVGDSAFLSKYNVVMWLDDQPGNATEMTGFRKYMERGGALICFHVCAYDDNSMASWPWYFDSLLASGQFKDNTWLPTAAKMHIEDTTFVITKGIATPFMGPVCEWYSFTKDVRTNTNIKVLFSIDPSAFPVGTSQVWTSGYYPIAWVNTKWKMLYDIVGHNNMNYGTNQPISLTWSNNAAHTQLILNALKWLAGTGATPALTEAKSTQTGNADMRVDVSGRGITVTRQGVRDFGISIVDLKGNVLSVGRSVGGSYSDNALHLGQGSYIIRSTSALGDASRTVNVLR